jgi:hypothetical protein
MAACKVAVLQRALGDVELRTCGLRLLLGLPQPPIEFGGVQLRQHLAGTHAVAFAQ